LCFKIYAYEEVEIKGKIQRENTSVYMESLENAYENNQSKIFIAIILNNKLRFIS